MVKGEPTDMVRITKESVNRNENRRVLTIVCESENKNDSAIIEKITNLIFNEQPRCENCIHFHREGYFCGYRACYCDIHGNIEAYDHPHHDLDGSKCSDYWRGEPELVF